MSERPSDPRPAWRDLFDEPALRRLVRLAALRGGEDLVWVGDGSEKLVKQLEKICKAKVKVRTNLDAVAKRSLGLIVAPDLVEQVGLEKALKQLRAVLETDGVLALVMGAAIGDQISAAAHAFWEQRQQGPLESVMQVLGHFSAIGMETLTVELAPVGVGEEAPAEGEAMPSAIHTGVRLGLFIGRRLEPGSPPRWPRRAGME